MMMMTMMMNKQSLLMTQFYRFAAVLNTGEIKDHFYPLFTRMQSFQYM